jgi:hypothetical protein
MDAHVEFLDAKMSDEGFDVGDAVSETQEAIGARGQAHTHMVRCNHAATLGGEFQDEVTPKERPRWIAVQ